MQGYPLSTKVALTKQRIREWVNRYGEDGVYVSFSGGKDSTIVLAIIKICQDKGIIPPNSIPAVYCDTQIELDAIFEFVKWVKENYYDNV